MFFIQFLETHPTFYIVTVIVVVISVVLHELGHGVAALYEGDPTPKLTGHMTLDPIKHMGGMSLIALFFVGIAWGAMPVQPRNFRHRWGDALVSFAGPAVNLLLFLVAVVGLGLWYRTDPTILMARPAELAPGPMFLYLMAQLNVVLFLFNLLPIPPLDGSRILQNASPGFRRFSANPDNQPFFLGGFILIFFLGGRYLWPFAQDVTSRALTLVSGVG